MSLGVRLSFEKRQYRVGVTDAQLLEPVAEGFCFDALTPSGTSVETGRDPKLV